MYRLSDVVYETPSQRIWVLRVAQGRYRVLEVRGTASVVRDTIHFSRDPEKALALAKQKADTRERELFDDTRNSAAHAARRP